jgi:TatD DNase family protein
MQLVDTHCHLDEDAFADDVETVVQTAIDNGVAAIVTIGTDANSSRRSVRLAERFPSVYSVVGIHPNYTAAAVDGDWEVIEELAGHDQVVAVGETGLDRYWDYAPPELQRDYFLRHLELSRRINKPFVVHCRDADDEVRAMLRKDAENGSLNGVMHSFCQTAESAAECLAMGMHLSFTGMLTFKRNDELRAIAGGLPKDRLFVETDAPYLAPVPYRGKRNEPAYVQHTLNSLAEAHGLQPAEMAEITTANTCRFFGIELPS